MQLTQAVGHLAVYGAFQADTNTERFCVAIPGYRRDVRFFPEEECRLGVADCAASIWLNHW